MAQTFSDNDTNVARAYSMMALNGEHVWAKYAREELDSLLKHLAFEPPAKIIDLGCGSGRHAIDLALRGFKVRAFDYVDKWVDRASRVRDEKLPAIESAKGSLEVGCADVRDPEPMEGADLVLCLYDVLGSSPDREDADSIIDAVFRLCLPGKTAVVGSMNGLNLHLNLPRIVQGTPAKEELVPVSAMQRCGEVFDYSKMAFDPNSGTLFRREQFTDNGQIILDTILQERRYLPFEVVEMMRRAGFENIRVYSVRAGKWEFDSAFDKNAPELLYIAQRPKAVLESFPRSKTVETLPQATRGYSLELIPRIHIEPRHAHIVSRIFCTSFGKNPRSNKMNVLGPKRMFERLRRCSYLCLLSWNAHPAGYMFGTQYSHLLTKISVAGFNLRRRRASAGRVMPRPCSTLSHAQFPSSIGWVQQVPIRSRHTFSKN